jgi:hypothetical protein
MRFMILAYFVVVFTVIWLLGSQIIAPYLEGTKFFPLFRRTKKTQAELEDALKDVTQLEVEDNLKHQLEVRQQFLKGKE